MLSKKEIKGLSPNAFIILQSIDGIGLFFAGGIIAGNGNITLFIHLMLLPNMPVSWKSTSPVISMEKILYDKKLVIVISDTIL